MRELMYPMAKDINMQNMIPILMPTVIEIRATTIPTIAVPNALPSARVVCTKAEATPTSRCSANICINNVKLGNKNPKPTPHKDMIKKIHHPGFSAENVRVRRQPNVSNPLPKTIRRPGSLCIGSKRPFKMLPMEVPATRGVINSPAREGL